VLELALRLDDRSDVAFHFSRAYPAQERLTNRQFQTVMSMLLVVSGIGLLTRAL